MRLSELAPLIRCGFFTVIARTGETCNRDTQEHPEWFFVKEVQYSAEEEKVIVVVNEDINYPRPVGGWVCPNCGGVFVPAPRCPDCGQLIKDKL